MALTGWTVTDFLSRAAVVKDWPVLTSALGYSPANEDAVAVASGQSESSADRRLALLLSDFGTSPTAWKRAGTSSTISAIATADAPLDTWYHLASVHRSPAFMAAYLDGASKGTNTTSADPAAPNATHIGRNMHSDRPWHNTGALAWVSMWDIAGFTEADEDSLAAKLGTKVNGLYPDPREVHDEAGQAWSGKLIALWRLADPTDVSDLTGNGHDMAVTGTLATWAGTEPPVEGTGPTAPTLAAIPTSWDAVQLDITVPGDATSVRVYRSTTSPATTADTLVADVAASGSAFDSGLLASTQYFYLPVSDDGSATTQGAEQDATTFADSAVETWTSGDPIVFPIVIPAGEKMTSVEVDLGKVIRAITGLNRAVDFAISVEDESEPPVEVGSATVLDVSATNQGTETSIPLASEPAGPQTLSVTITPTIAA